MCTCQYICKRLYPVLIRRLNVYFNQIHCAGIGGGRGRDHWDAHSTHNRLVSGSMQVCVVAWVSVCICLFSKYDFLQDYIQSILGTYEEQTKSKGITRMYIVQRKMQSTLL